MTLQTQHTANAPATLTDEQRRRVADALENAQSVNTRRNYAGQYRKFRAWCEREKQSALPAQPEVVAAYAAELAEDGKSMSTIRLAVGGKSWTHTGALAWNLRRHPASVCQGRGNEGPPGLSEKLYHLAPLCSINVRC